MGKTHRVSASDLFAQPIRLKTKHSENMNSYVYGTKFGVFLTLVGMMVCLTYVVYLMDKVQDNQLDKIEVREELSKDNLHHMNGEIKISDVHFMPSLNIRLIKNNLLTWKKFDDDPDIDVFDPKI